jgi:hypothetical protein
MLVEEQMSASAVRDTTAAPDAPPVPLRRNLQFQTLWLGQAASSLGVSVATVAYPLAILALTGSPARAGLFAALQTIGMLAGALPGGQLADRRDRRTIVIAGESVRALVTGLVAVGLVLGWLSLALLLLAAVVLGAMQSVTSAARMPLVRSVVPAAQLTTALVQDEVRQEGASLAGPPLAGALYAMRALAHAVPFVFTAVAFVLSMLAAVAMKAFPAVPGTGPQARRRDAGAAAPAEAGQDDGQAGPAAGQQRNRDSGMLAGVRTLWASPVLRATMLLIMMVNSVGAGLDLVIIVLLRDQHVRPGLIGTVLAAAAAGGLAGAPLVKPLHRIRPGVLLLAVGMLEVPVFAGLALPFGIWWAAALLFAGSLVIPAVRVLLDVLILRQTPDELRGRVVAAVMALVGLGMPAGLAATGALLQWLPARSAMLTLAAVLAVGVAYCATSRDLWRARWPG